MGIERSAVQQRIVTASRLGLKGGIIFAVVAAMVIFTLPMFASDAADAAEVCTNPPAGFTKLSACATAGGDLCIGSEGGSCPTGTTACGAQVYVDTNFAEGAGGLLGNSIQSITVVSGASLIIPDATRELDVATLTVQRGGSLQVGAPQCPIGGTEQAAGNGNLVTIKFVSDPYNPTVGKAQLRTGLFVDDGARVIFFGLKGTALLGCDSQTALCSVPWARLSAPAGDPTKFGTGQGLFSAVPPGGNLTIEIAHKVDWQPKDWIVVASTDFQDDSSEFVQIAGVSNTSSGATITLSQPLANFHFGGADPGVPSKDNFNATAATNFGIDERAEVGLLTRGRRGAGMVSVQSAELSAYSVHRRCHFREC